MRVIARGREEERIKQGRIGGHVPSINHHRGRKYATVELPPGLEVFVTYALKDDGLEEGPYAETLQR